MNAEQKRAWVAVLCMGACLIGYAVLVPFVGPWKALSAFALFGVVAVTPLIGWKEHTDERDRLIARRATLAGAMCSYLGFYAACMGVWIVKYAIAREATVSVHVFPMIAIVAGLIPFMFARAVAVLILYNRHMEAEDA